MKTQSKFALSGLLISIIIVFLMIKFVDFGTAMGAPIGLGVFIIIFTFTFSRIGKRVEERKNRQAGPTMN